MNRASLYVLCMALCGCVSIPVVDEASDEEPINFLSLTCQKPYALERDCSTWSGATRKVLIGGNWVKVAGSADGKVILVMDPIANALAYSLKDFFLLNSPSYSKANNANFENLRDFLVSKDVGILRVRPVRSLGDIDGYVLELDSDGYGHLVSLQATQ